MKRPCILFGEQAYAPNTRLPFPVNTDFEAPRDMEVEAVWMGATGPEYVGAAEQDIDVNFKVKTRPDLVQGALMPMRLFASGLPQERSFGWSQRGWDWRLKYPYRIKHDVGLNVEVLNQIPIGGGRTLDRFGFAAHALEVGQTGRGQRELMLFDFIPRASTAARKMLQPQRTASADGRADLDIHQVTMIRGALSLWPSLATEIPYPRRFYLKVTPVGREDWSMTYVPLPAYGLHGGPWESAGVFWRPPGELILPQGYSFDFDVRNNAGVVRRVQIAVLGYVEEE